jgi:hypothetical protein
MAEMDWSRFAPVGYDIDWSVLTPSPLTEIRDGAEVLITAGDVLREALPHLFTPLNPDGTFGNTPARQICDVEDSSVGNPVIKTPSRTIQLKTLGNNSSFTVDVVTTLIRIAQLATPEEGFHPIFFYYDDDIVVDDPHEGFRFFVVNGDRIVLDHIMFNRHSSSGFNSKVFNPFYSVTNQVWRSEPSVQSAKMRGWYRRFYEETYAGRLTTLRDDVDLYYYVPDWKQREVMTQNITQLAKHTARMERLLIFVLVGISLVVLRLWS